MKGVIDIKIYDLRDYTDDKHRTVDDSPYGGGPGMVLKVEPIFKCIEDIKQRIGYQEQNTKIILFSAKGKEYFQTMAQSWSALEHIILICGRYEGVDERVAQHIVDEEISIGKYVLTGGELPAMVVLDSVARLVPGSLGNPESLESETHGIQGPEAADLQVDYPVFTRPGDFGGWKVPKVLLEGNHSKIEKWRADHRKPT